MSRRTRVPVLLSLLLSAGCGASSTAGVREGSLASHWPEVTPHTAAAGRELLQSAAQRYPALRSYRDHGIVVTTLVGPTTYSVYVSYFDTLFVRDSGFRLRFYDERRRPLLIIWRSGDRTLTWHSGKVGSHASFEEAIAAARGVTSFLSELTPSLLLGTPFLPSERAVLGDAVGLAGTAPGSCGRCRLVALGSAVSRRQHVFTIDERDATVRRVQSFLTLRSEGRTGVAENVEAEELIVYEPEFDVQDEASLVRELAIQPW